MSSNELQGYKKTLNSPYTGIKGWIDSRLPLIRMMEAEYLKFPVPKSLNYFWSFGGIAMFCLIGLILTGIFLILSLFTCLILALNFQKSIPPMANCNDSPFSFRIAAQPTAKPTAQPAAQLHS